MKLFTIGYSGKSEAKFFEILREAGVSKIIDVRRLGLLNLCHLHLR